MVEEDSLKQFTKQRMWDDWLRKLRLEDWYKCELECVVWLQQKLLESGLKMDEENCLRVYWLFKSKVMFISQFSS